MKKILAAILSAAMVGSLVSCGSTKSSSNDAGKGKKTIGIAMPAQELERWNSDGEYLKNKFESAGYNVELKFSNNDAVKQNNDIVGMIDDGVDLLLIAAVEADTLSATLDSAVEKNIPVVAYDRLIRDSSAITYYVSYDNFEVGRLQGEFIRDALDLDNTAGPYNIEIVAGDSGDYNADRFFKGEMDVLEEYIESGKLVVPSGLKTFELVATPGWTSDNAKANMTKILNTYYSDGKQLDAVVCANDSTALGVIQALDESYKGSNTPVITGQDGDIANLKNIVDGTQAMTVYKNVENEVSTAYEVCKMILDGDIPTGALVQSFPFEARYDSESYNNGVKYVQSYLLVPAVITDTNLQLLVNTGQYKWDSSEKYLESAK
ncbi:sugar-binding protein [Ruminococcus flavefaciens]|uniref:substrate-binding domain-containing protein n=1 Tax=Ruminococcus flavefaciens TaxID=1265 RepID=UPI0026EE7A9C|nr:sugar-binding protein [Ruminococcus flavefaciens]MDD7515210.1 sugar ABC transporter substrate-binding protein [Ruminococcus flavefaciens]MDY5691635.1 sugar-binding protein [Ruminococcus flavefaciens]